DLLRLIQERRRVEEEELPRFEQAEKEAGEENEKALQKLAAQRESEIATLDGHYRKEHREQVARLEAELAAEEKDHAEALRVLAIEEKNTHEKMKAGLQDALWAADSFLEAGLK